MKQEQARKVLHLRGDSWSKPLLWDLEAKIRCKEEKKENYKK
jgi:hypothetical protein